MKQTSKKILGLDIGTNSIGWALIESDFANKTGKIEGMGARIIPMSQDILGEFGRGNSISQTAERTRCRSARRLRERHLLRRERLHRVLHILGFLPEHYAKEIDFKKRLGQFHTNRESKLAYKITTNNVGQVVHEFVFKTSFNEMLVDFKKHQPQILTNEKGEQRLIPYDWTIYYLRKKALTQKIEKEELAWIILNFNQKRGYYQARGDEEEDNSTKSVNYYSLKVVDVKADETSKDKSETWYSIILENGWVYRRASKTPLYDWNGKVRDFIVTTELNEDGTEKKDKEGNVKRSFRAPTENDWTLLKKKTEHEIILSGKTVGEYIYDTILQNPTQKIHGKLVRTIERKFYKEELKRILLRQIEFHPELKDTRLYNDCVRELYRNNENHQIRLSEKNFIHLFIDDIIFYQRPLRSQKSTISDCPLEFRQYKDKDGNSHIQYLKAIPKSNPYYQEFRLWQWIRNLSIYRKDVDINVTSDFIQTIADIEKVFDFLNERKDIDQKQLLRFLLEQKGFKGRQLNSEIDKYRWNYVEDKKYPCNETGSLISSRLEKVNAVKPDFLNRETVQKLWHIIYSVTDKTDFEKALTTFALKHELDAHSFVEAFKKFPPFPSQYGAYSEKAIKKLLPLMRVGKYWSWDAIDSKTKLRIEHILSGEFDKEINNQTRDKIAEYALKKENDFSGLPEWLAKYVVYGRHSEASITGKWNSVLELEQYLKEFKQHSLRNPIVEQVITETLRVVKDIWMQYGNGAKDFFDEIHIELGREMKKTKDERERDTQRITENENTNLRIKALLAEMANDVNVENVRPFSPMQQEILKLYEEQVLSSTVEIDSEILKISKSAKPSSSELKRYKLWLEQKYRSPYTGKVIPLNRLFTSDYEIEHIIPQSRYFDDSLSNKVICETAINKLKDNQLGFEFIKNHHGQKISLGLGEEATIFSIEEYEEFVKTHYAKNRAKRIKLLLEDIPEKMIERQLNDTRYISKFIGAVLSNIVRADSNDDGVNSRNVVFCNGTITNELRQDWGLNDIWNDLILPRFERLNTLMNTTHFTAWNENYQKHLPTVPLEFSKGFSKKRIDHRHHALDALVIACATRDHVNLLNNKYAKSTERHDLNRKLRKWERVKYFDSQAGKQVERDVPQDFLKPWSNFTQEAKNALENIIVSFKQSLRVINKATNYYEKWETTGNIKEKKLVPQKGTNWAIRKQLHKDTVAGKVILPWIKVPKGKLLTATRKSIDSSFNLKMIESITDTGIQKILKNYLAAKANNPEIAFSPEGLEDLNKNIALYNNGKMHQPIYKARIFELGSKFPLGQLGNKASKYVEAAKGTNLFFAIYQNANGKRSYDSIPLNVVIERQKQGLDPVPMTNEKGDRLLFHLSPNDLVYVPTEDETENNLRIFDPKHNDLRRIYKVVSFTGNQIFFVLHCVASSIVNKIEFSSLNKMERSIDGIMIKEICIKLKFNRLGHLQVKSPRPIATKHQISELNVSTEKRISEN